MALVARKRAELSAILWEEHEKIVAFAEYSLQSLETAIEELFVDLPPLIVDVELLAELTALRPELKLLGEDRAHVLDLARDNHHEETIAAGHDLRAEVELVEEDLPKFQEDLNAQTETINTEINASANSATTIMIVIMMVSVLVAAASPSGSRAASPAASARWSRWRAASLRASWTRMSRSRAAMRSAPWRRTFGT